MNYKNTEFWKKRQNLYRKYGFLSISKPDIKPVKLEKDVAYFILKLESLGAITLFSCEGHSWNNYNFYIDLIPSLKSLKFLKNCNKFSPKFKVSVENPPNCGTRYRLISECTLISNSEKYKYLGQVSQIWEKS
jgi:hypothetical protein